MNNDEMFIGEETKVTKPLILIAEYNDTVIRYVHVQLKAQIDADFTVAMTSKLAFERAVERKPDLITMNTHFDDGSGIDLLQRLKNDERTMHIPVLVLTEQDHVLLKSEPVFSKAIGIFDLNNHKKYCKIAKMILED